MTNWVVLKFGGSSVGEAAHWQTIATQLNRQLSAGNRCLLVLSALKNVSNLLEALLHQSLAGVHPNAISHLKELHLGFAAQLKLELGETLEPTFSRLTDDCNEIYLKQTISPKYHARVLACGELLSTLIGTAYLNQAGISSLWQDVRKLLKSRSNQDEWHHYTSAQCHFAPDSALAKNLGEKNQVIVTQGFIAEDDKGETVLLGREGSDTSAAYLGAKLKAKEIQIWTDVAGVYSSNPREIYHTQQLPQLSYQQASQMAALGAKVLHPRAIKPAMEHDIFVRVKSTGQPEHPGTVVSIEEDCQREVCGVVYENQVTQVEFQTDININTKNNIECWLKQKGFDRLLEHAADDKITTLWIYHNSDQPQPDERSLLTQLSPLSENHPLTIKSELSLISVIGRQASSNWLKTCQKLVKQLPLSQHFQQTDKACFSLLTDSESSLALTQHIHDQLFGVS